MRVLKGAVFGCGMIAEHHLRAWRRIPDVQIVALGDQDVTAAEERRNEFAPDAKVYTDLPNLLERENLDFVDILTPPHVHREHCLAAKRANVHIICQKPIADTLDSARSLVSAMADHMCLFSIHENHRYRPWFQVIRKHVEGGFFGNIRLLRWEEHEPSAPDQPYKRQMERGIMLEYGSHLVDQMRALIGDPKTVLSRMYRIHPDVKGDSLAHTTYVYDGLSAVMDISWKKGGAKQNSFLVVGDKGEAYYEGDMRRGESARFRLIQNGEVVVDQERSPAEDFSESFYLFQQGCVQAMLGKQNAPQHAQENLKTLVCTMAAYQSAAEKRTVSLLDEMGNLITA